MLIEPSQPHWQLLTASCHRRAGNYRAALELYRSTHRRFPDHLDCLRLLTRLCADLELSNEAQRYSIKLRRAEKAERLVCYTPRFSNKYAHVSILTVPRTHNRFGDRGFVVAGPRLWNSLPKNLRQISSYGEFRRYPKNHLFGF